MAKGMYIGIDNIARKIKEQYIGVNNVARKVTKGYIGVNNVARLCFAAGCSHENTGKNDGWTGWHEYDDTYHVRDCLTCGEVEYEEHTYDGSVEDTGDGVWEYCTVCGYAHWLGEY